MKIPYTYIFGILSIIILITGIILAVEFKNHNIGILGGLIAFVFFIATLVSAIKNANAEAVAKPDT